MANLITLSRILLILPFCLALLYLPGTGPVIALIIFVLASLTDAQGKFQTGNRV